MLVRAGFHAGQHVRTRYSRRAEGGQRLRVLRVTQTTIVCRCRDTGRTLVFTPGELRHEPHQHARYWGEPGCGDHATPCDRAAANHYRDRLLTGQKGDTAHAHP